MNAARRKKIATICDELVDITTRLQALADEEQEAFEAMPESLQTTERGEKMENTASDLQTLSDELNDFHSTLLAIMEA